MRFHLAWVLCLLAAGCATRQPEPPPEVRACLPERQRIGGDYDKRLARLSERARVFGACMESKGYVLDQAAFDDALLRHEYTLNADPLGGDPQRSLNLRKQELLVDPAFWRKPGDIALPSGQAS